MLLITVGAESAERGVWEMVLPVEARYSYEFVCYHNCPGGASDPAPRECRC